MDTISKTKLAELAQRQLRRRQVALQATLEEIAGLEANQALFQTPQAIAGYHAALENARTKRDRQEKQCNASQAIIEAFTGKKGK